MLLKRGCFVSNLFLLLMKSLETMKFFFTTNTFIFFYIYLKHKRLQNLNSS